MKLKYLLPVVLLLILAGILAATFAPKHKSQPSPTATPTQASPLGNTDIGGSAGVGGGAGSGGGGGGSGNGGGNGSVVNPIEAQTTPSPSPSPLPELHGPYVVEQTETLGGEKISGTVCDVNQPFSVNFNTPKVAFITGYIPKNASSGSWSYAYNLATAGETHKASGSYTLTISKTSHKYVLTMTGSDAVAFKGFSGPFPVRYVFNLVPSSTVPCP